MFGIFLAYVGQLANGQRRIVNKAFLKMGDELGYDVELAYKKIKD